MEATLLWLVWQNEETRNKYHVGNLIKDLHGYYFQYNHDKSSRNVEEALANGFLPLVNFPNVDQAYHSVSLFPAFSKRLPNKSRPDYKELLERFGARYEATDMELLRITKGRTTMDSLELYPPITVEKNGLFQMTFYIEGWRYYKGNKVWEELENGQLVQFNSEPDNSHDPFAVEILSESGVKLGYVPAIYSEFISKNVSGLEQTVILRKQQSAIPEMKVMIYIEGKESKDDTSYHNLNPTFRLLLHEDRV